MNPSECPTEEQLLALIDESPAELARHLDSCDACRQHAAQLRQSLTSVRELATALDAGGKTIAREPNLPGIIGKYLVVGRLAGRDEFESFRAIHSVLNTDLRIDMARTPLPPADEFRDPYLADARRLMAIDDRRLSRVRDCGFFDDRLYLVADYGPEERLDQRTLGGALTTGEVCRIVAELGAAAISLKSAGIEPPEFDPSGILLRGEADPVWTSWAAQTMLLPGASSNRPAPPDQRLARLFVELVAPRDPRPNAALIASETIRRLRSERRIAARAARSLSAALVNQVDSIAAIECLIRGLSIRPPLWTRIGRLLEYGGSRGDVETRRT